jgi:toxin ParE1/3/4
LVEIWLYLVIEASEAVARRQLDDLEAQFHKLQTFPMLGVSRDQFGQGLRVILQGAYGIYYLPLETEIIIIRVLHGSREINAIADQGGFVL